MNTRQAVTAIDPTAEIGAILDFAEAGYPKETAVVIRAAHQAVRRIMRNGYTRRRAIDAYRCQDLQTFGALVAAAMHSELCQAAWARLEESFQ